MIKWPHTINSEASLECTTWKVDFIRRTSISALFCGPLPRSRSFGVLPFVWHSSRTRKSRELRCDLKKSAVDERADNRCARAGVWHFALCHHAPPLFMLRLCLHILPTPPPMPRLPDDEQLSRAEAQHRACQTRYYTCQATSPTALLDLPTT
jgi:hypothetical protein